MITILIVDDHTIVRTGIARLLADVPGFSVIAEATSGEEAVLIAKEKMPNVVLMDIKMPGIGGLEATKKMLRHNPDLKIIILTVCTQEPFPTKLLHAGAVGYLTKNSGIGEIINAIKTVYSGRRYLDPLIAQQLALNTVTNADKSPLEVLSDRELQVMIMITAGQKVQAIAKKLCVTTKTINSYRYRLFEKLKIATDVELTHLAIKHGLTENNQLDEEVT